MISNSHQQGNEMFETVKATKKSTEDSDEMMMMKSASTNDRRTLGGRSEVLNAHATTKLAPDQARVTTFSHLPVWRISLLGFFQLSEKNKCFILHSCI